MGSAPGEGDYETIEGEQKKRVVSNPEPSPNSLPAIRRLQRKRQRHGKRFHGKGSKAATPTEPSGLDLDQCYFFDSDIGNYHYGPGKPLHPPSHPPPSEAR